MFDFKGNTFVVNDRSFSLKQVLFFSIDLGGVAISDQYVLSAAHCFRNYHWNMISLYSFVMGHHKINEIRFTSEAKRIVIHSLYTSQPRLNNDIALIELKTKIDFNKNNVGFICLPMEHVKEEDAYPVIGQKA